MLEVRLEVMLEQSVCLCRSGWGSVSVLLVISDFRLTCLEVEVSASTLGIREMLDVSWGLLSLQRDVYISWDLCLHVDMFIFCIYRPQFLSFLHVDQCNMVWLQNVVLFI